MRPEDDINAWCKVHSSPAIVCGGPHVLYADGTPIIGSEGQQEMAEEWKFEPSDPGCGLEQFIGEAIGAASTCWEKPEAAGVFDSTRARIIADAVYQRAMAPDGARLGMATTEHLLRELLVRFETDVPEYYGDLAKIYTNLRPEVLDYRTVDDK